MTNALAEQRFPFTDISNYVPQKSRDERVGVVGLGYVGLPISLALAEHFEWVVGYDTDRHRVNRLKCARDWTREIPERQLLSTDLQLTSDHNDLENCSVFVVAVPTPVDGSKRPDLNPLKDACRTVARYLRPGTIVVFESTVYPGATEEVCAPVLAQFSGLTAGKDFHVAYSPERISPGDPHRGLDDVVKIIAAENPDVCDRVASLYSRIVTAGVHLAPSIKVAEAAKVFENTQRDVNIGLMNEFALLCDRMGVRTQDVLEATGTKWNALPFTPGLVGGHCIGVDPYYLAHRAQEFGLHPEILNASRRMNERMGPLIAQRAVKFLSERDRPLSKSRVGIIGLSFKENVPDLRNSKVFDIIAELETFGIHPLVHDPVVPDHMAMAKGVSLCNWSSLGNLDVLIYAVPHQSIVERPIKSVLSKVRGSGVLMDIRSKIPPKAVPKSITHWCL